MRKVIKKKCVKKEDLERKIQIVRQAIIELRSNPDLMKKMEKTLSC
jgi:hypothetical protein